MRDKIVRLDTLETLFLDASTKRSFKNRVEVTDNPIDGAADVVDHAESKLKTFEIRGVVSEKPFVLHRSQIPNASPSRQAREFLRRAEEKPLRVVTERHGRIEPVFLEDWPYDEDTENGLHVRLRFKEGRLAESQTVEIPPEQTSEPALASQKDAGSQSTFKYFTPEVPKEFDSETSATSEQFDKAKGRRTDKEVANKSLGVRGIDFVTGRG